MNESAFYSSYQIPAVSMAATGSKITFCPHRPIRLLRALFVPQIALSASATATFTLRIRPTPGSATGEITVATATYTTPASGSLGSVFVFDAPSSPQVTVGTYAPQPSNVILPGQQLNVELGTLGLGSTQTDITIEYQPYALNKRSRITSYFGKLFDQAPANG